MPDFPVRVLRTAAGDYTASLVDLADGPLGQGIDPYAALEDLREAALDALQALSQTDALPTPTQVNDQPVISFEPGQTRASAEDAGFDMASARLSQSKMICYSWTNVAVLSDS